MEGNTIVSEVLNGEENYQVWRVQVKTYLLGQDLWDAIETNESNSDQNIKTRRQKDALALHAILICCNKRVVSVILEASSARAAWTELENLYRPKLLVETIPESKEEETEIEENNSNHSNQIEGSSQSQVNPMAKSGTFFKGISYTDEYGVRRLIIKNSDNLRERDPISGKTALGIAISEGNDFHSQTLIDSMDPKDLEIEWECGSTALSEAIEKNRSSTAQYLILNNRNVVRAIHQNFGIPVVHAAMRGRWNMIHCLYSFTPLEDLTSLKGGFFGVSLMTHCIYAKQLDIPLDLVKRAPILAITEHDRIGSVVYTLASANVFRSKCQLNIWQRWIYDGIHIPHSDIQLNVEYGEGHQTQSMQSNTEDRFNCLCKVFTIMRRWTFSFLYKLFGMKNVYEMKLVHDRSFELLSRVCYIVKSTSDEKVIMQLRRALLQAARKGDVEFFMSIVNAKPDIFNNDCTDIALLVLEAAIELRNVAIFKLVYTILDSVKNCNNNFNIVLHKAAITAPLRVLNRIPGPALQMQSELRWFKEVESIASPIDREITNEDHLTPRDLFTESHKDLVIAGEKWMKETASSCTVVGALIITVTFASAFTFPGGNDQNTGFPMFTNEKLFRVFTISNAVALFSSTTSALMFLGILTSRYREKDFLRSLPTKLMIGLSMLFFSIAAMIIAFCVGLAVMFERQPWIIIPSICLASIPIASFVWVQFSLFWDVFISTFWSNTF